MVWEDSTAFVSVSVWILSGVQGGSGVLLLVQETLGQFCEVQERPTRKATPTPDSKKRFVLELIKVLFPSGESLLYPYRAPPPKKKSRVSKLPRDLNGVGPPCDGSRCFLRGGREKPSHRPRVTRSPRPYRVLKPASQGAQPAAAGGGAWRGSWAPGAD